MIYSETLPTIEGIIEPAIINYFATINQERFAETALLFTENGELLAPFKNSVIGREKISSYLNQEAKGMKLLPKQGICETKDDSTKYKVLGQVKTSLFSVNVAWHFILNGDSQITIVEVKLLASPQELLSMQSKGQ